MNAFCKMTVAYPATPRLMPVCLVDIIIPMIKKSKYPLDITPFYRSRRSLLKTSVVLAGAILLITGLLKAQSNEANGPLIAYVGTFSSPLHDVLPTQVDLPPGNGHGIHLFKVNRATGAMMPAGIYEMGTSPSCLILNATGNRLYSSNETDRVGENKEGTISAFSIDRS